MKRPDLTAESGHPPPMGPALDVLEQALGHSFRDRELLERALTHKSRIHERPGESAPTDNEQLEFLGDAILGFVVSECLVHRHSTFVEGQLSKLKAHLVSAARLYEVAQGLNLGEFLFLGRGEELSGGREKKALLADAVEALIAAIHLDGGLEPARRFIEARVVADFSIPENGLGSNVDDYKSALQELAQQMKLPPPRYVIVSEDGPEHSKMFTVEVRVGKECASQAQGLSKKAAGQKAARLVIEKLAGIGSVG